MGERERDPKGRTRTRHEQIEHLIEHPVWPRGGPIDFVHDDHHLLVQGEGVAQHEARLGHRPLDRVDQEEHPVAHVEDALHLAAEVGVARGVDEVELVPLVADGRVLGHDGDAALALEVVAVHDAGAPGLVLPPDLGLGEHGVDEGRLAVVDVRDDGDIAEERRGVAVAGAEVGSDGLDGLLGARGGAGGGGGAGDRDGARLATRRGGGAERDDDGGGGGARSCGSGLAEGIERSEGGESSAGGGETA